MVQKKKIIGIPYSKAHSAFPRLGSSFSCIKHIIFVLRFPLEQDDLPYDSIVSVDGKLQKVVYISEEDFIPVLEILSFSILSVFINI